MHNTLINEAVKNEFARQIYGEGYSVLSESQIEKYRQQVIEEGAKEALIRIGKKLAVVGAAGGVGYLTATAVTSVLGLIFPPFLSVIPTVLGTVASIPAFVKSLRHMLKLLETHENQKVMRDFDSLVFEITNRDILIKEFSANPTSTDLPTKIEKQGKKIIDMAKRLQPVIRQALLSDKISINDSTQMMKIINPAVTGSITFIQK